MQWKALYVDLGFVGNVLSSSSNGIIVSMGKTGSLWIILGISLLLLGLFPASVILTEMNTLNLVVSSLSLLKLGGREEIPAHL